MRAKRRPLPVYIHDGQLELNCPPVPCHAENPPIHLISKSTTYTHREIYLKNNAADELLNSENAKLSSHVYMVPACGIHRISPLDLCYTLELVWYTDKLPDLQWNLTVV